MPPWEIGDILEVTLLGRWLDSVDVQNRFQFLLTDGSSLSASEAADDFLEIMEALFDLIKAFLVLGMTWNSIKYRSLDSAFVSGIYNFAAPLEGENDDPPLPSGVSGLVTFSTDIARVNFRKYLGGLGENTTGATGNFGTSQVAALLLYGTQLLLPLVATNATWRYGYKSPKTGSFVLPTTVAARAVPAYQRRRRLGTGS